MTYNKDVRPRLKGNKLAAFNHITSKEKRILVIGDIHAPFTLHGYLDFCKETYAIYNCNQVIFIGDIIDNHYSSFHTTDPDGMGGGDESAGDGRFTATVQISSDNAAGINRFAFQATDRAGLQSEVVEQEVTIQ